MTLLGMLLNLGTDKNNSGQQQYCRVVQKSFFEAPFSQFKVNIIINYHTRCFAVNSIITIIDWKLIWTNVCLFAASTWTYVSRAVPKVCA